MLKYLHSCEVFTALWELNYALLHVVAGKFQLHALPSLKGCSWAFTWGGVSKCLGHLCDGVHKVRHGLTLPSCFLNCLMQSQKYWGLEGNWGLKWASYPIFPFLKAPPKIGDLCVSKQWSSVWWIPGSVGSIRPQSGMLWWTGRGFSLGYIQGFNFYTETKADRNLKKEEWFWCYKYLQKNNQLSGVDVFTVSRDNDRKDVGLKVSAGAGHSHYKALWK